MAGWLPHENKEKSRQILESFISEKKVFAIVFGGKVIGSLGVEEYEEKGLPEFDGKYGREIGCVLSKDYWGQGLMPEAVKEVIRWLFEEKKLDFIVYRHYKDNLQSQRVREKCGFVYYKTAKHETRYGAVKDCVTSVLTR